MTTLLCDDLLRLSAPSIFASQPWERMSHRYKMVPTAEVLGILRDRGFHAVRAQQGRSRIPGKADFTRHMIRFRHEDYLRPDQVGQELPELVLTNSHDGTAAYRFNSGIFRLACMNGLVVASADFGGISVKHSGGPDFGDRVIDATCRIIEDTPKALAAIEDWKGIMLTRPQQIAFAEAAAELRPTAARPLQLLASRRREDDTDPEGNRDLWRTLNVVQEHTLKGGIRGASSTGRRTMTRPIRSVEADVRTNRALWLLAARMAELV